MNNTVLQYPLREREWIIDARKGAELLSIAVQGDVVVLYALSDPSAVACPRHVYSALTGEALPATETSWTFIGTASLHDGNYILHVFAEVIL